jgi:tRNA-splicing ligase RtcB
MSRELRRVADGVWEVEPTGGMHVPARLFTSDTLLAAARADKSVEQACNVAHLPGIVAASLAMPDMHEGYGFPIGGVAAFSLRDGVVSPGGVGYDINCGVRLARTDLTIAELGDRLQRLVHQLQRDIPAGVGSEGAIATLSDRELDGVLRHGSAWAVENGWGESADLDHTEASGALAGADPAALTRRARERGAPQLGTLGSGNHFAEVQVVDETFDDEAAACFGLIPGCITVMIHSGSRGLGYQVCDDALGAMHQAAGRHRIELPDPQLVAVPIVSAEGERYLAAMRAAASFAWANRR